MDNDKQIHTTLKAINLDHENNVKTFKELLESKAISFEQFTQLINESQKRYDSLVDKLQDKRNLIDEKDMQLYYQTKEKIAAVQYRPRTFGEVLCDTTGNISRGLEALTTMPPTDSN